METHSQHLFPAPPPVQSPPERMVAIVVEPFALWLAERYDPTLRRTPLVACAEGRVIHANAVARRKGIERGMQLMGARLRAATLALAPNDEPNLRYGWDALVREVLQRTPWVDGRRRGRLLTRLREDEAQELAHQLHARVGIADDLQNAELCALASPPGEARSLASGEAEGFLKRLPLRFLRGIGLSEGDLTRLQWLGVRSAGELAGWGAEQLRAYLGERAPNIIRYLHGPAITTLDRSQAPMLLRRALNFEQRCSEPAQLDPALDHLSRSLALALEGRAAQQLTLIAERGIHACHATRQAKEPLRHARQILQQARFALRDSGAAENGIDTLILELSDPQHYAEQATLWHQREQREEALQVLLERYPQSVKRAQQRDPFAPSTEHAWGWTRWDAQPITSTFSRAATEASTAVGIAAAATARTPALKSTQSTTEHLPPMDVGLAAPSQEPPAQAPHQTATAAARHRQVAHAPS